MIELDSQLINSEKKGVEVAISGSAAIARALIEASVKVVTSYPGAPCTETIENLIPFCTACDFHIEWSINEKVAFEVAAGAAIAGVRAAFITKHVGMNVASDSLMHVCYAGVNAGMVIISTDDPGAFNSSVEEDTRFYAKGAKILGVEVSNQQEAKDIIVSAFDSSEKMQLPVFIRATNRILYGRGKVSLSKIGESVRNGRFEKNNLRWFIAGKNVLKRHQWLSDQQKLLEKCVEEYPFNVIEWALHKRYGIITTGVSYYYTKEVLKDFPVRDTISILKVACFNPLPKKYIKEFLNQLEEVLVIEELEPVIEEGVRGLAQEVDKKVQIYGRRSNHLSGIDFFSPEKVKQAINKLWGKEQRSIVAEGKVRKKLNDLDTPHPRRYLAFCPGCPHRFSLYSLKSAIKKVHQEFIFVGDPGCSLFGIMRPFGLIDISFCMGASMGIAGGMNKAKVQQRIAAIIGDSSFLHAGIPALINCCYNNVDIFVYILDNQTIAMTGLQPSPSIGICAEGEKTKKVILEDVVRDCGVDYIAVVDPYKINKMKKVLQKALWMKGQRVVIARRECPLQIRKTGNQEHIKIKKYKINYSKCKQCKICITVLGCPALSIQNKKVHINEFLCAGCGLCSNVCPYHAITH